MAEEHDTDARDKKAWRRITSVSRTLAKQAGKPALADEIANANHHQDAATQSMRRSEAIATLLEELAGKEKGEAKTTPAPKPARESE